MAENRKVSFPFPVSVREKKRAAEMISALLRLNEILDELDLKQYPLSDRELGLLQDNITDQVLFRLNSGRRYPETIIKRLKRDQIILLEANRLLDEGVKTRELANRIKRRLKLSLSTRQIRRIYRGK